MKVIFMGTPHFAVPTLQALIDSQHEIVGVFTKPPKPAGRGYELLKTPVHQLAEKSGLRVFTPSTFKIPENIEEFKALNADIAVVAAYGLILRKDVLELPKHGCINVHPSMLPRWRGAAPIQHTILAGDKEAAVCIMQMDEGLDTGDVIIRGNFPISPQMTAYELHDFAADFGGKLIIKALEQYEKGEVVREKQSEVGLTYATKITKDDERIKWEKTAFEIDCQIRTLTPKPAAFFKFNGEIIKIISADIIEMESHSNIPGTVVDDDLTIACGLGFIRPNLLQREGKKMMYRDAFLRGFSIPKSSKLD